MKQSHRLVCTVVITTVLFMGCAKSENSDQNTAEIHEVTVSALTVQAQSISLIENLPGRVV